jgi:hypothetical protein
MTHTHHRSLLARSKTHAWISTHTTHILIQLPGMTQNACMETTPMPDLESKNIPISQFCELSGKAFQTKFWREANFKYFELTRVHRQKNQEYVSALIEVREGRVTPQRLAFWMSLQRSLPPGPVEPTLLYPLNKQVNMINTRRLAELDAATEHKYACEDRVELVEGAPPWAEENLKEDKDFFLNNHLVPKELVLRKGAQVPNLYSCELYFCELYLCKLYFCEFIFV